MGQLVRKEVYRLLPDDLRDPELKVLVRVALLRVQHVAIGRHLEELDQNFVDTFVLEAAGLEHDGLGKFRAHIVLGRLDLVVGEDVGLVDDGHDGNAHLRKDVDYGILLGLGLPLAVDQVQHGVAVVQ